MYIDKKLEVAALTAMKGVIDEQLTELRGKPTVVGVTTKPQSRRFKHGRMVTGATLTGRDVRKVREQVIAIVEHYGNPSRAAKAMGMDYTQVWGLNKGTKHSIRQGTADIVAAHHDKLFEE